MALGSIVVRLSMATADFETDAGRAAKVAEKRAKQIDQAFKKAGVAIGLALGAALIGVTAAIKGSIDKMDDLSKAAQRVGLPTEEFSQLAYAGGLADVGIDTLVSTLGKLTKSQAAAYSATSQQAKVFDALGIAAFDAGGKMRDSTDVLADFADRFNQMKGSPEIMAAGFALFGRSFQDMIPLLKDGADGIRAAAAESDKLGYTLSTEAGQAAEKFNDDITRLQTAVNGFWQEIAIGMLPALDEGITKINKMAGEGDLANNAVTLLSAAFKFGVGALEEYNNAVARVSISMGIYAGVAEGALEISKNMLSLGIADGSISDGFGKQIDAFKTGQRELDALIAKQNGWTGKETAAGMFPVKGAGQNRPFPYKQGAPDAFNFAADQQGRNAAKAVVDAKKLQDALGNVNAPRGGSKGKAAGGKSDAAREAEEAKRAADAAAEAQNRWHDSILDMTATLAGPAAQVNREYEANIAKLADDFNAGKVALNDYATAQELYGEVRDRDLKAIEARRSPAQQMLEDMQFEIDLLGKSREQQELMTAARHLGVDAMKAEGQAALAKMAAFQQADEASRKQIELMDQFRNGAVDALTDFVTGAASAEDALKSFVASMAAAVAQAIAQQWIKQLFGGTGTSSTGSAGGWVSLAAQLFSGGKAEGGYTGPGGKHEYAGPVHKGEVVWSQADVARAGGVGAVESARMTGGGAGGGPRKPQRIILVDNQRDAEALMRSSTGESATMLHIGNNIGALKEMLVR